MTAGWANYLHRVALSLVRMRHEPVIFVAADEMGRISHHGVEVRAWKRGTPVSASLNRLTAGRFSTEPSMD